MERGRHEDEHVTRGELRDQLDKLPTRWEVRFLIMAAVLVNQFVPVADTARAAIPWL